MTRASLATEFRSFPWENISIEGPGGFLGDSILDVVQCLLQERLCVLRPKFCSVPAGFYQDSFSRYSDACNPTFNTSAADNSLLLECHYCLEGIENALAEFMAALPYSGSYRNLGKDTSR